MLKCDVVVGEKNSMLSVKCVVDILMGLVCAGAKPIWGVVTEITLTLRDIIGGEAEYQGRGG